MKTTLDIADGLLIEAKALANRERLTLTRLIEQGLELRLRVPRDKPSRTPVRLPIHYGQGGLVTGIDPTSNHSLFEAADP